MEPGPSPVIERIIGWLIPPACHEEVLGDLRERYRSPAQYWFEAACVIPCVVWSRIQRTTDAALLLLEWMSIYAMLVFATLWLDRAALYEPFSYFRLAVPPLIIVAVMTLEDAYADPRNRRFDPLAAPGFGFAVAGIFDLATHPTDVFIVGGFTGTLIVASLRVMFPPAVDQPLVAKIPAFWQRLELVRPRSLVLFSLCAAIFFFGLFNIIQGHVFAP